MDGHELLQRLLDNPTETLSVEVKRWLDPKSEAGIEKIAKGCLALFNNNGGHMIVGYVTTARLTTTTFRLTSEPRSIPM